MLSFSVIGCGAAGNKAVIDLMNAGFIEQKCVLINSTNKDIPDEYQNNCIIFGKNSNRLGGCGKERSLGKEMILEDLKNSNLKLDDIVSDEDQAIVIVGSTEGGTGSSCVPVLAKYYKQVYGKNVICVLFFGFEDDARGLKNSVELCQELSEDFTVIGISNKKFLDKYNGNKFKAEKAANEMFVKVMRIISGEIINKGSQMIDNTDLYKIVTTTGFMYANSYEFKRPKNIDEYHKQLTNFLYDQEFVSIDKDPGAKRIGLIFDVPDGEDNVDYSGEDLKTLYGEPFELFTHMNNNNGNYSLSFIISGMRLPSEEIKEVYNEYINRTEKVNKNNDSFFNMVNSFKQDENDVAFDMMNKNEKSIKNAKNDFFASFGVANNTDKKKTEY